MEFHAVAADLRSLLVEVIDLPLTSKPAQWSLGRPLFEPLWAELDDLAADEHVKSSLDPKSHSTAWRRGGTFGGR